MNLGCDPDTLAWLCVTSNELYWVFATIAVLVLLLGIRAIIRSANRKYSGLNAKRGIEPGQGKTLLHNSIWSNDDGGGGHASVALHTKDPQAHARGFVPTHATKDRK